MTATAFTNPLPTLPEDLTADLVLLSACDWRSAAAFLCTSKSNAALARQAVFAQRHGSARAIQTAWRERGHRRAAKLHGRRVSVLYDDDLKIVRGMVMAPARGTSIFGRGLGLAPATGGSIAGTRLRVPREGRPGRRVHWWQTDGSNLTGDYLITVYADFLPWHRVREIRAPFG